MPIRDDPGSTVRREEQLPRDFIDRPEALAIEMPEQKNDSVNYFPGETARSLDLTDMACAG